MIRTVSGPQAQEIADLITWSWYLIDHEGGVGVESLFTPDGTLTFGTSENRGTDTIRAVYRARRDRGDRTSRHVITNLLLEDTGEGVTARYVQTLYAADGRPVLPRTTPIAIIDVTDELVHDGQRWLLRSRHLRSVFRDEAVPFAVPFTDSSSR